MRGDSERRESGKRLAAKAPALRELQDSGEQHRVRDTVEIGRGLGPKSISVYRDWPAIVLRTIWVNLQLMFE